METARICKDEWEALSCERGDVLDIVGASYGRSSNFARCGFSFTDYCHAPKSLEIVQGLCQRRRSCTLHANNAVFGNPCPNVRKYLKVVYSCIPENATAESSTLAANEIYQTLPLGEAVASNTTTPDVAANYGVILTVVAALVLILIVLSILVIRRRASIRNASKKPNAKEALALNSPSPRGSTTTEPQYEEINGAPKSSEITPTAPSVVTVDCEQREHIEPFLDDEVPSDYLIINGGRVMDDNETNGEETVVKRVRE